MPKSPISLLFQANATKKKDVLCFKKQGYYLGFHRWDYICTDGEVWDGRTLLFFTQ